MARLDLETVIDTGIALADEHGLEAVSLRRIARRLTVTPMALYRYVASKDDLLDAMADRLYADVIESTGNRETGEWWDSLADLARSTRKVLFAHPWATPLFARPLAGPHAHALDELLRTSLRSAGFSAAEGRELHDQLSNMVFALVAPELRGRRNRAAFERGLELLHAGLEARRRASRSAGPRSPAAS